MLTSPTESIVPYVEAPEAIVPGKPLFFASAIPIDGYACGVLGQEPHGASDQSRGQPGPSREPGGSRHLRPGHDSDAVRPRPLANGDPQRAGRHLGAFPDARSWTAAKSCCKRRGPACAVLTQTVASPTLADQLRRLGEQFPAAKWHSYEPLTRDAVWAGCRLAFGEDLVPVHHLDQADVIVSLDADFLARGPGRLNDARGFAARREVDDRSVRRRR